MRFFIRFPNVDLTPMLADKFSNPMVTISLLGDVTPFSVIVIHVSLTNLNNNDYLLVKFSSLWQSGQKLNPRSNF